MIEKIRSARLAGRTHFMVVVAEGAGSAPDIAKRIHEATGLDPRVTVLGHIQRGGSPTARDRVTATRMGFAAVTALAEGRFNRIISIQSGSVTELDMEEALTMKKPLNEQQYAVLAAMTGGGSE